jgi:hypothetical protein
MLAIVQVKALWHITDRIRRVGERRIRRLTKCSMIELHTVNAHLLQPNAPLFVWKPGRPEPDPHLVSQAACARWSFAANPTLVCVATRLAANLFGSTSCGIPRREQVDHDLLLGTAYLHYRGRRPSAAEYWVGEHVLPKAGYRIKDPDASIRNAQGQIKCIVESSGRYAPEQVESFHEHCAEQDLPYELW